MKMKGSREDGKSSFYFSSKALQNVLSISSCPHFPQGQTHRCWHCLIYLTKEFKP